MRNTYMDVEFSLAVLHDGAQELELLVVGLGLGWCRGIGGSHLELFHHLS